MGGGGGGAGGIVILEYQNKTGTEIIDVSGGWYGSGNMRGGAGSKGIIIFRKY